MQPSAADIIPGFPHPSPAVFGSRRLFPKTLLLLHPFRLCPLRWQEPKSQLYQLKVVRLSPAKANPQSLQTSCKGKAAFFPKSTSCRELPALPRARAPFPGSWERSAAVPEFALKSLVCKIKERRWKG